MKKILNTLAIALLANPLSYAQAQAPEAVTSTTVSAKTAYSPSEDFYTWVNHQWLADNKIPADKPGVDNFLLIKQQVNDQISTTLDILASKEAKGRSIDEIKLATMYQDYLDIDTRNQLGITPIASELKKIDDVKNYNQASNLLAYFQTIDIAGPVVFDVSADLKEATRNIVYVGQGGLGLPRAYYVTNDERSIKGLQSYQVYLQTLFSLAKQPNPEQQARKVVELETQIAKMQWSEAENRNIPKMYNLSDLNGVVKQLDKLNIEQQLKTLSLYQDSQPFDLVQNTYLSDFNNFYQTQDLSVWKSYLKARLLSVYSDVLTQDFNLANTKVRIKLGYVSAAPKRKEQAVNYLNQSLGMLLGKAYVQRYFSEQSKDKLEGVIANIKHEYRNAITQSLRMDEKTKQSALDKLDNMSFKIGYPDKWQDYASFNPVAGQLAHNHMQLAQYEHQRTVDKLFHSVDKNEWDEAPQKINAYYDPTKNKFVLLAGILHPPFFSENAIDAQIYGGIGFIIGHEIGHAFDDQGSQFDANGNLHNWWSAQDAKTFNTLKNKLIAQANSYQILPNKYLNGQLDVGEIIGDLSGAEIAFKAFEKEVQGRDKEKQQAYQTFFIQLAKTWRSKYREDILVRIISSDPHPPGIYRVNSTLMNMSAFQKAYQTKPGDGMYRAPKDRVELWPDL